MNERRIFLFSLLVSKIALLSTIVLFARYAEGGRADPPTIFDYVLLSEYPSLSDAVSAIGATETELWIDVDETLETAVTCPANVKLRFLPGATLGETASYLSIYRPENIISRATCFTESVTFQHPGVVNQMWWGTDDTALQDAVDSLIDGCTWHLPAGTYTQTTQVVLSMDVKMVGESTVATVIHSAVPTYTPETDKYAIVINGNNGKWRTELRDFTLSGDADGARGSTGNGGIKLQGHPAFTRLTRVRSEGFASGTTVTAGEHEYNQYAGFWLSGTQGVVLDQCYAEYNDIGYKIDKGSSSQNTTTTFNNCSAERNRTHAVLWDDTGGTIWNGGVIQSNHGLETFRVDNTVGSGNVIRDVYFEGNHLFIGENAPGSRGIAVNGAGSKITLDNIDGFNTPYYPEIGVALNNTIGAVISGSKISLPGSTPCSISIASNCRGTALNGISNSYRICDQGAGTKITGDVLVINNDDDWTTDHVAGKTYTKLPSRTITDFVGGLDGQILILEAQDTTLLGASEFVLNNGASHVRYAEGSIVTLRKNRDSGKWVLINHQVTAKPKKMPDLWQQIIDDRSVYKVQDKNETCDNCQTHIGQLSSGWPGQIITFTSDHTNSNTAKFWDYPIGTGAFYMALNGDFVMGRGDSITLLYNDEESMWVELSRSQP